MPSSFHVLAHNAGGTVLLITTDYYNMYSHSRMMVKRTCGRLQVIVGGRENCSELRYEETEILS